MYTLLYIDTSYGPLDVVLQMPEKSPLTQITWWGWRELQNFMINVSILWWLGGLENLEYLLGLIGEESDE